MKKEVNIDNGWLLFNFFFTLRSNASLQTNRLKMSGNHHEKCSYIILRFILRLIYQLTETTFLAIIAKYGVLIREKGGLYYALLKASMNKITLWKNVCVGDLTIFACNENT